MRKLVRSSIIGGIILAFLVCVLDLFAKVVDDRVVFSLANGVLLGGGLVWFDYSMGWLKDSRATSLARHYLAMIIIVLVGFVVRFSIAVIGLVAIPKVDLSLGWTVLGGLVAVATIRALYNWRKAD